MNLLLPLSHFIKNFTFPSSLTELLTLIPLATSAPIIEDLLHISLLQVISLFLYLFLQLRDLVKIGSLFLMLLSLFVRFESLMELFVLQALLLFFKRLDLVLLLKDAGLNLGHVLVTLQHLCEKIIWSTNGDLGLDEELHGFLHVFSG